MQDVYTITETQALATLIQLSLTAIKNCGETERVRNAAMNALELFADDFLGDQRVALLGERKIRGLCERTSMYEAAYLAASGAAGADLKALWYVFYPYLVAYSPRIDADLYEQMRRLLHTEEVFQAVLSSRYAPLVYNSAEDLQAAGLAGVYAEWYAPYYDYIAQPTERGLTRETEHYQKRLAAGDFAAVAAGTDRILDRNPYDYDALLLNVSARVSLLAADKGENKAARLNETQDFISNSMPDCPDDGKLTYLYYYRGLCRLGLAAYDADMLEQAKADLQYCLSLTPGFELASFMLSAIADKLESN